MTVVCLAFCFLYASYFVVCKSQTTINFANNSDTTEHAVLPFVSKHLFQCHTTVSPAPTNIYFSVTPLFHQHLQTFISVSHHCFTSTYKHLFQCSPLFHHPVQTFISVFTTVSPAPTNIYFSVHHCFTSTYKHLFQCSPLFHHPVQTFISVFTTVSPAPTNIYFSVHHCFTSTYKHLFQCPPLFTSPYKHLFQCHTTVYQPLQTFISVSDHCLPAPTNIFSSVHHCFTSPYKHLFQCHTTLSPSPNSLDRAAVKTSLCKVTICFHVNSTSVKQQSVSTSTPQV